MFHRNRAKEIIELLKRNEINLKTYDDKISGFVHIGAVEAHFLWKIYK